MTEVGDLSRFGIGIGKPDGNFHSVSVFMGGVEVNSEDNLVYLPSFLPSLEAQSSALKHQLNFLQFESIFDFRPVEEIHKILMSDHSDLFVDDSEHSHVFEYHRFMNLNEPSTDFFSAFLIPAWAELSLTFQLHDETAIHIVKSVIPFELITVIDEATAILRAEQNMTG